MVNPPPCTLSSHDYRPLCLRRAFSIGWKQQFFSAGGRLEEKERPYLWGSTILSLNTTIVVPLASQFYCEQKTEQLPLYLRLSWTLCPSVSLCLSVSVSESLCLSQSRFILVYLALFRGRVRFAIILFYRNIDKMRWLHWRRWRSVGWKWKHTR